MQHLPVAELQCAVNSMPATSRHGAHRCWKREACNLEGSSTEHGQEASVWEQMVQREVPATARHDPAGRALQPVDVTQTPVSSKCRRATSQPLPVSNQQQETQAAGGQPRPQHFGCRAHVDAWGTQDQQASCSRPTFLPGQPPALHPQPLLHSGTPPEDGPGSLPARSLHDSQQQSGASLRRGQPTADPGQQNSWEQLSWEHEGPPACAASVQARPASGNEGLPALTRPSRNVRIPMPERSPAAHSPS